jgi:cyclopropane-fatty-acyl-phospholipid synthase
LDHISVASEGTLIVEKVENIGGHYAKTLRLWKENFLRSFDSEVKPALKKEHLDMTEEEIDVFCRKWEVSAHTSRSATSTCSPHEPLN